MQNTSEQLLKLKDLQNMSTSEDRARMTMSEMERDGLLKQTDAMKNQFSMAKKKLTT